MQNIGKGIALGSMGHRDRTLRAPKRQVGLV